MRYTTAFGVEIDSEVLSGIAIATELFRAGELRGATEAEFYKHCIALAKATYPVNANSLRSCIEERRFGSRNMTPADHILKAYRFMGILALIVLVLVQSYWLVGSVLISNIPVLSDDAQISASGLTQWAAWDELNELTPPVLGDAGAVLAQALSLRMIGAGDVAPQVAGAKITPSPGGPTLTPRSLYKQECMLRDKVASYNCLLNTWAGPGILIVNIANWMFGTQTPSKSFWTNSFAAKEAFGIMQTYLLPPLYGWLGAIAYVLRRLIADIKARTFQEDSNVSYNLRVYLGILAGMAIGWGFASSVLSGSNVIRSLSPLALAFLAGYSVELLFSAMDKLLEAFSTKSPDSRPLKPHG